MRDSNPYVLRQRNLNEDRPPISPIQHVVGVAGLEPATSCPQSRSATAALYPEIWWAMSGSNQRPSSYELGALTNCANGPYFVSVCMLPDRASSDRQCSSYDRRISVCSWTSTSSRNNGSCFLKTDAGCRNTDSWTCDIPAL